MADHIQFDLDYNDLSTDNGFQFEFTCQRCGSGFRTEFEETTLGKISGVLEGASTIFGGVFGTASDLTDRVKSGAWQQAHDKALKKTMTEMKPNFIQCPRCHEWVCRKNCWNTKKGLCKECAPDLGVEMAAAQASKSVEEVWAHAAMAEEDKKLSTEHWRKGVKASCPACEAPLASNVKFCPECGAKIHDETTCKKCQVKLSPKAKFCAECGERV